MERRSRSVFDPGLFKTRINFYRQTIATNANGFEIKTQTLIHSTKAKWINARGSYENQFSREEETDTSKRLLQVATVTMRFSAAVRLTDVVEKDGLYWEIVSANDINDAHKYLKLDLQRIERNE